MNAEKKKYDHQPNNWEARENSTVRMVALLPLSRRNGEGRPMAKFLICPRGQEERTFEIEGVEAFSQLVSDAAELLREAEKGQRA